MSTLEPVTLQKMTDEQFSEHVWEILGRELGTEGVARFLRISRAGAGDYTRDRHNWQDGTTVRQIVDEIVKHREASAQGAS